LVIKKVAGFENPEVGKQIKFPEPGYGSKPCSAGGESAGKILQNLPDFINYYCTVG